MQANETRRLGHMAVLALLAALGAAVGLILWKTAVYATVAPPSFDGAMNMNTAASWLAGHGYGFRYTLFFPFPAQSDGPLILPSALAMAALGKTALATQLVNFLYVVALAIATFFLVRHVAGQSVAGALAALLAISLPGFSEFAMNGYGEIPVAALGVGSLLLVTRALDEPRSCAKRLFVAGLLVGLCFITKTIAVVLVLAVVGSALLFLLFRRPWRFWPGVALLTGAVVPVLTWEVFRIVELGGLRASAGWWNLQLAQAAAQSGGRRAALALIPAKLPAHLELLAGYMGVSVPWMLALLLGPYAIAFWLLVAGRVERIGCRAAVLALTGASAGYFAWWLMIAPTEMAWLRRIQIGLVAHAILVAMLAGLLWRVAPPVAWRVVFARIVATLLLVLFVPPFSKGQILSRDLTPSASAAAEFDLAAAVRNLPPDATVFGFDWWKAPVVAFYSGRNVENINQWDPAEVNRLPSRYLVLDRHAAGLARADFDQIARRAELRQVLDSAGGRLYEIVLLRPYPDFSAADRTAADLSASVALDGRSYKFLRGVYQPEGEFAWTGPEFALLLQRAAQRELHLRFGVHPALLAQRTPVALRITSPGCLDATIELDRAWFQDVTVPLTCPPSDPPVPMEITLRLGAHMPVPRQIDMDGRRLGLLFSGADLRQYRP